MGLERHAPGNDSGIIARKAYRDLLEHVCFHRCCFNKLGAGNCFGDLGDNTLCMLLAAALAGKDERLIGEPVRLASGSSVI